MSISEVIGWKFSHQHGMRCDEVGGEMVITKFPGGIPSQADQDLWTAEYLSIGVLEEERATMNARRAEGEIAMHRAGVLPDVIALMADQATDPEMVIAWNRSQDFDRNSPMINAVATTLGWSDTFVDELFRTADAMVL